MGHARWVFGGRKVDIDMDINLPDEIPNSLVNKLMDMGGYSSFDEVKKLGTDGAFIVGKIEVTETDNEYVIEVDFPANNDAGMRYAILSVADAFSMEDGNDPLLKIIFNGETEVPVCRGVGTDGPIKYALATEIFHSIGLCSMEDIRSITVDDIRTDLVGCITAKYNPDMHAFTVTVDIENLDDPEVKATIVGAVGESLGIGSTIDLILLMMAMEVKEDHESRRIRN